MGQITLSELASEAERQFQAALGPSFVAVTHEVFGASSYRGGFCLVFAAASGKLKVAYSDLELEVTFNGQNLFGHTAHGGFAGNMFTREHLQQSLPGITAASVGQLSIAG